MSTSKSTHCEVIAFPCRAAQALGQHIRQARGSDERPLEEIARGAGLTATEWLAIEEGRARCLWEQVCLIATTLALDQEWLSSVFPLYLDTEEHPT